MIKRALKRTEVLGKYNGKEEGADFALLNFNQNQTEADKLKQAQVLQRLEEVRRKDLQQESKDREAKLTDLQKQLGSFEKKEKDLLVKKYQMQKLQEKGPDYLVEQELARTSSRPLELVIELNKI